MENNVIIFFMFFFKSKRRLDWINWSDKKILIAGLLKVDNKIHHGQQNV